MAGFGRHQEVSSRGIKDLHVPVEKDMLAQKDESKERETIDDFLKTLWHCSLRW